MPLAGEESEVKQAAMQCLLLQLEKLMVSVLR